MFYVLEVNGRGLHDRYAAKSIKEVIQNAQPDTNDFLSVRAITERDANAALHRYAEGELVLEATVVVPPDELVWVGLRISYVGDQQLHYLSRFLGAPLG